jgi:hypothetical protein
VLTQALRELAETPDRWAPVVEGTSVTRFMDERVCILQGPTWAGISGVNVTAHEVPSLVDEVRERVPAGKDQAWWIGPSAQPTDLHERLLELGFREPADRVGTLNAVALTREPGPMPGGVSVRRVETFEDFVAAREVQWDAFETPEERRELDRPRFREDFEESMRIGVPVVFLAELDGRPAATAMSIPSERGVLLIAGSTAVWARGRGLYRGLVRARWDDAVARGTPGLVVMANPETSYPILKRLGFEDVCTVRRLEDPRVS